MSGKKVVISALVGIAVGALLGILFAPSKGKETRQKFHDKGKDFADKLKKKYKHCEVEEEEV